MLKLCIVSAALISLSIAAPLKSADAQSLPSRTIGLTCTRSVTPETPTSLKGRLFAEPLSCIFYYKIVRNGRSIGMGEFTVALPANNESLSAVKTLTGAQTFDSVEISEAYTITALPISRAWVGGRCKPVQGSYPKQTISVTSSKFLGVYRHSASLEERFSCR